MASSGHHARHATRHGGVAESQLRPHPLTVHGRGEALDVDRARHQGHPPLGGARRPKPGGDALAHRDQGVRPTEEPALGPGPVDGPAMVHGTNQAGGRAESSQRRQPVVVGLMRVDHVDLEVLQHAPHRRDLGQEPPRTRGPLERDLLHQRNPGRADVRFERISQHAAKPDRVAARPEGPREVERGVRASGPPGIRHQVQDPEPSHRRPESAPRTAASTWETSIASRQR